MITLVLPYPPSVNHVWRHVVVRGRVRVLLSAEGRLYRSAVIARVLASGITRLTGAVEVEMDVYPPDRKRRDIDNTQKCVLDALTHAGVYEDDSQVGKITVERLDVVRNGKVIVRIREREGKE